MNTGPLGKSTLVLFEADEHGQWPSGVKVSDSFLIVMREGVQSVVPADVRLKASRTSREMYNLSVTLSQVCDTWPLR